MSALGKRKANDQDTDQQQNTKRCKVAVTNKFPLAPPVEGLLLDTRELVQWARGCESVFNWGLAKTDCHSNMPNPPDVIFAQVITKRRVPNPEHSQAQHNEDAADYNTDRVTYNDTRIQYETHGMTHIMGGGNRVAWPVVLALWRSLGTKPYRKAVATTLAVGCQSESSSVYRAFTKSPLAERKVLKLILDF